MGGGISPGHQGWARETSRGWKETVPWLYLGQLWWFLFITAAFSWMPTKSSVYLSSCQQPCEICIIIPIL